MIKKILKLGATFLMSLTFLAPLNVKANDDDIIINVNGENETFVYIDPNTPLLMNEVSLNYSTYASGYTNNSGNVIFQNFTSNTLLIDNSYPNTRTIYNLNKSIKKGTYDFTFVINHSTYDKIIFSQIYLYDDSNSTNQVSFIYSHINRPNTGQTIIEFNNVNLETDKLMMRLDCDVQIQSDSSGKYPLQLRAESITYTETGMSQIMGDILNWLQIIDTRLMGIDVNISTTVSSVRIAIEELHSLVSTTINNNIINIRTSIENFSTQLRAQINVLSNNIDTWIKSQTTSLSNKLDEVKNAILGNGNTINNKEELDSTVDTFNEGKDMLDEIELGITGSLSNVTEIAPPTNGLSSNFNFIKTAQFISNEMSYIYNSHNDYMAFINILLVLGIAFLILGISVKR